MSASWMLVSIVPPTTLAATTTILLTTHRFSRWLGIRYISSPGPAEASAVSLSDLY